MKSNIRSLKMIPLLKTLAIPFITWLVCELIDRAAAGTGVVSNIADVKALLRTLLTSFSFALAINCNLTSGRMDLSAGAQMYMGCIFGGNMALSLGVGGVGVLILSMLTGALCGLLVGVLFVHLRILPMVLGLGVSLVFECLSFGAYSQQGLKLFAKPGVEILSNIGFILVVALALVGGVTYLFQYSGFGYKRRAIQGNQKLAADSGINIYTNCILCYVLAGALVACAGVFDTAYTGGLTPVMGMTSNTQVFKNMFPMALGLLIGSYCQRPVVGILLGSLSVKILTMCLSKLAMDSSMQNIIIYSLFLLLNVYRMNAYRFDYAREKRARIHLAQNTRRERTVLQESA